MLYFDSSNRIISVDSIYSPIIDNFIWVLDLEQFDFTLNSMTMLLEITTPSIEMKIEELCIRLPTSWYIVIYDDEIGMMDVVQVSDLLGRNFKLFTYGFNDLMVSGTNYILNKYIPKDVCVMPNLNKKQFLCHPINGNQWICVGPTEAFAKKLKDMFVGELI